MPSDLPDLGQLSFARQETLIAICDAFEEAWHRDESPSLEDYLNRLTHEGTDEQRILFVELLRSELEYRRKQEPGIDWSEYAHRFGELHLDSLAENVFFTLIPRLPNRYRSFKFIDAGGQGEVYRAVDTRIERPVAVKVRHVSGRFLTEPALEAKDIVRHPNVVVVYDVDVLDDGRSYMIMEWVSGETLEEYLQRYREQLETEESWIPQVEAVRIVQQIANGLEAVHRSCIYRDLKPANVLLGRDGRVKLTDFGLAVRQADRWGDHALAGTRFYLAPEEIEGKRLHESGDIFRCGIILYELLTSRLPFDGDTLSELFEHIGECHPAAIRSPVPGPEVSKHLTAICDKCLQRHPQKRFKKASELAERLGCWLLESENSTKRALMGTWTMAALVLFLVMAAVLGLVVNRPQQDDLMGRLDVLVYDKTSSFRRGASVRHWSALPVHSGDRIRVAAQLDTPAACYLLWIDSRGHIRPVYPWEPGNWKNIIHTEWTDYVNLPVNSKGGSEGWLMTGEQGMETLLLLATRERLPAGFDLRSVLPSLVPQPLDKLRPLIEVENGIVVNDGRSRKREIDFRDTAPVGDPLLESQRKVWLTLRPHFELIHSLTFAYGGDTS